MAASTACLISSSTGGRDSGIAVTVRLLAWDGESVVLAAEVEQGLARRPTRARSTRPTKMVWSPSTCTLTVVHSSWASAPSISGSPRSLIA